MSSNLPPGLTESMLPGNRDEDVAWDNFADWALDKLGALSVTDAERAVLCGIAAVAAEREKVAELLAGAAARAVYEAEMEADAAYLNEEDAPKLEKQP